MDCCMPGFPVLYCLPELVQTHVHWVGDAVQPSHSLLSPSPPALNLSQHQVLFQRVGSLHQVAKYWSFSFSFSISISNEYSGLISFGIDSLISLQSKGLSRAFSSTAVGTHRFFSTLLCLWSSSHIRTWLTSPLHLRKGWTYQHNSVQGKKEG